MSLREAGVYKITCKANSKIYIGSSTDLVTRLRSHKRNLNKGVHHSRNLQNSWNKYGEDCFEFEVLMNCDKDFVLFFEQMYLDYFKPEFNTQKIARNNSYGCNKEHSKREVKERSKKYYHNGAMLNLTEISNLEGIAYNLLSSRLKAGWSLEEALANKESMIKLYEFKGDSKTISAWARDFGVAGPRLYWYIKNGSTIAEALHKIQTKEKALSLAEFCKINSAVLTTVKSRIKQGMAVMEAITTETKITGSRHGNT